MKIWIIIFLTPFFIKCTSTKKIAKNDDEINNHTEFGNLLPLGKSDIEIIDSISYDFRVVELTMKMMDSVETNHNWFIDYMKDKPKGEPIPYHSNLGITKAEYIELENSAHKFGIQSTIKDEMEIVSESYKIKFKAAGNLQILNTIEIDLREKKVFMGDIELSKKDTINVTDGFNILNSKWKGYEWKFESPSDFGNSNLLDLYSKDIKLYTFTIGKLERTDETYIKVTKKELNQGVEILDISVSFFIRAKLRKE